MTDGGGYLYIPTKEYNEVIRHKEIPEEYCFMRNGKNQLHITRKELIFTEDNHFSIDKSLGLCGRKCKGASELNRPPTIGGTCIDCLRKFNEIMKSAMYDEEEEEFFLPK